MLDHKDHNITGLDDAPCELIYKGKEKLKVVKDNVEKHKAKAMNRLEEARKAIILKVNENFENNRKELMKRNDKNIVEVTEKLAALLKKETEVNDAKHGGGIIGPAGYLEMAGDIRATVSNLLKDAKDVKVTDYKAVEDELFDDMVCHLIHFITV